jgi:hypothetical protein
MEEKLTLNDGTELTNSSVILSGFTLYFYLSGITMADAFALMNDQEKTAKITAIQYGRQTEYTGFTDLRCITHEDNDQITGSLRRVIDNV